MDFLTKPLFSIGTFAINPLMIVGVLAVYWFFIRRGAV
jgi:hypothetical protein